MVDPLRLERSSGEENLAYGLASAAQGAQLRQVRRESHASAGEGYGASPSGMRLGALLPLGKPESSLGRGTEGPVKLVVTALDMYSWRHSASRMR